MSKQSVSTQTFSSVPSYPYTGIAVSPKPYVAWRLMNRNLPSRKHLRNKSTCTEPHYFAYLQNDVDIQRELRGIKEETPDSFEPGTTRLKMPFIHPFSIVTKTEELPRCERYAIGEPFERIGKQIGATIIANDPEQAPKRRRLVEMDPVVTERKYSLIRITDDEPCQPPVAIQGTYREKPINQQNYNDSM